MSSEEILIELTNTEIEEFREFYKNLDQPEFVYAHLYLKNQLQWNLKMLQMSETEVDQISQRCKMKFYRNRNGSDTNKTIIGIANGDLRSFFVMSLDSSLNEVRECLLQTNLIDWNKQFLFCALLRRFHKMIYELFEVKMKRVRIDNFCSTLWMDKAKASTFDYVVPDDLEIKSLSPNDARLINENWPYKHPGSEAFVRSLIILNGGLGIFKDRKLVSWILQVESFGLGLLQTLDEHQGKGYARILTRAMTKHISKDLDEDVILFASYSKPKTVDLYVRYGFKHVSHTHWMYSR